MEAPQRQDLGLVHFRGLSPGGKKVGRRQEKRKEVGKGIMTPGIIVFLLCEQSLCAVIIAHREIAV